MMEYIFFGLSILNAFLLGFLVCKAFCAPKKEQKKEEETDEAKRRRERAEQDINALMTYNG